MAEAVTVVLDVGKTNIKLVAVGRDGELIAQASVPNRPSHDGLYQHIDVDKAWGLVVGQLAELSRRLVITAIVPTTHGGAAALIDERGLVLPVVDYELALPAAVLEAYAAVAPPPSECGCHVSPMSMTVGGQLFWQQQAFPEAFARARWLLTYPQYWSWRLSGVAACEISSLGAQSQLWDPRRNDFSSLVERQGWRRLFAPLRPAWDVLGPIKPELAAATGVPAACRIICGVHDSNASLLRYLRRPRQDFALLSTGTWIVGFALGLSLDAIDWPRDMVANTTVDGRPVVSTHYAGGRELERLLDGAEPMAATMDDLVAVLAGDTMELPSATGTGPFAAAPARRIGPAPATAGHRAALAALTTALVTDVCLELLQSRGEVILEGGFAGSPLFCAVLAARRPGQPVLASPVTSGTALGASLLADWLARSQPPDIALTRVPVPALPGLDDYARRWRAAAEANLPR